MRPILLLLTGALCLVLVAACGDDDDATPTPDASPTSSASDTSPTSDANGAPATGDATPAPSGATGQLLLPTTPVLATLIETYHTGQSEPPSADQLPVGVGGVQALWYQSGGKYVVYYAGLALPETIAVCPGNSIETDSGFEHISNAPTVEGACEGATTLAAAPAGVKICAAKVLYLTEIPVETEGTLHGSVEAYLDDGSIVGVTSQVEADAAATPEIDLSSCSDAVS